MNHPIDGQQYTLIGDGSTPSIARGDSYEASRVTFQNVSHNGTLHLVHGVCDHHLELWLFSNPGALNSWIPKLQPIGVVIFPAQCWLNEPTFTCSRQLRLKWIRALFSFPKTIAVFDPGHRDGDRQRAFQIVLFP